MLTHTPETTLATRNVPHEAPRPATQAGRASAHAPRWARPWLGTRQDRRPRHQGAEVSRRLQHPRLVRRWADAAARADAQTARFQEPIPGRICRGEPGTVGACGEGHADHPGRFGARWADPGYVTAGQDPGQRGR